MGSYATQEDMVARFGEAELIELTDRENREVIVPDLVERALEDAEAEINSYLGSRYPLPLANPPKVLVRLACDIARYHLYGETGHTEVVKERYESAVKMLRCFANGTATLGVVGTQEPTPSAGGPEFFAQPPVFNRETLRDFQ